MKKKKEEKIKPYQQAWSMIKNHFLLGDVAHSISLNYTTSSNLLSNIEIKKSSLGYLSIFSDSQAEIVINKEAHLKKEEWFFVFSVVSIILALDLYKKLKVKDTEDKIIHSNILKESSIFVFAINYVYEILGIKDIPEVWEDFLKIKDYISIKNELSVYEQAQEDSAILNLTHNLNLLTDNNISIFFIKPKYLYGNWNKNFSDVFAESLVSQAQKTIVLRSDISLSEEDEKKRNTEGNKAKRWFMNHYPLLSSLASQFEIVEDLKTCQRLGIDIGAVSAINKTIYINPNARLNEQGMRFVIAHEILHIALNHSSRLQGRDPLMWNLACDFVINHWLVTMKVGIPPPNIFMDKELAGKSADEIYLMIAQNNRLRKKMGTLKSLDAGNLKPSEKNCDMLDYDFKYFSEFEDACKESLLRGVFLHESIGRGTLPADLVEEIKAINQPPIPWQVELARWIVEHFPLQESIRTYARPSRRQSSTPDIPRPRYIRPLESKNTQTFGVILDTSGSMDKELLGKCLGAIASYSMAQEIKYIRLVFCDVAPYDEGYVPVEILSQKLKVKGRGGTVIQQAVNYLENVEDFPKEAPILILSDGFFESDLKVTREHAFLVPKKAWLPFIPSAPVFEFK